MLSGKRLEIGAVIFVFLIAAAGIFVFRPNWIVTILAKLSPGVVYFVETEEPVVALTIDDGPDTAATSRILDLLRRHEARATFFVITSRVPGKEEILRRTVDEGHELGNHLTSDEPSILLSSLEFEQRLIEAHRVLSPFSGVRWFRPGSGWYNNKMLSIIQKHGYQCALGSVYPFDPHIPSSWFATHYVIWNVQPGSIIVLHDYGKRGERTVETLAAILPELNRRGFRVVTLSGLMDMNSERKQQAQKGWLARIEDRKESEP